jgi:hypothetical protein
LVATDRYGHLIFLNIVNPCVRRVGWLSVANLVEDQILKGEKPSLVVPTVVLFGNEALGV